MSATSGHAVDRKPIPTGSTQVEKSRRKRSIRPPRTIVSRGATGARLTERFALLLLAGAAGCTERFEIEDSVAFETTSTAGHSATTDTAEPRTDDTTANEVEDEGSSAGDEPEEELCTNTYVRTHGHQESYLYVPGYSPSAVPLQLGDTDFTIEFWTKFDDTEEGGMSLSVREPSEGWSFVIQPNYITGIMAGRFVHQFAVDTVDGEWHHVAWSYNHLMSRLFIDGVLVSAQAEQSLLIPVDAMFRGGVSAISATAYEGAIDDVRISNTARYLDDFEVGPVSHDAASIVVWPFDEGEGDFSDGDGTYGVNLTGVEWMLEEYPCG